MPRALASPRRDDDPLIAPERAIEGRRAPGLVLVGAAVMSVFSATACESTAPASARATDRSAAAPAREWTGTHGDGAVVEGGTGPATETGGDARTAEKTDKLDKLDKPGWVLHIGDSFVHAWLQQSLRPRFRATGTEYVVDATTATYTTTWANDAKFDEWLARRPSLVLVTLGANEVEMPVPTEHARAIETITRKIIGAGASCVWITPPMWKADSGILQVIHDHSAPCLFFDSDAVEGPLSPAERQRDHIHPNERGGARWAAAFWDWLVDHRDPTKRAWALVPFERR